MIFNNEMSGFSSGGGTFNVESIKSLSPEQLEETKKQFVHAFNHVTFALHCNANY
jgi:hypothetical protein